MDEKKSPKTGARYAATEALAHRERTRLPLSPILDRIILERSVAQSDRHLAMKIAFGVLRKQGYLNLILSELCNRPISKLKTFVHQALLCGLYQVFFLDRIPDSAAVNETVKIVKAAKIPKQIQGFVNGVLRESIRKRPYFENSDTFLQKVTPAINHPAWLIERWHKTYGVTETNRICTINDTEPLLTLRTTHQTTQIEYIQHLQKNNTRSRIGRYAPNALLVEDFRGPIASLPAYEKGFFQVQDQAAQLATMLTGPFVEGFSYLDCCAGVGGKTTHLVSLLEGKNCSITALEPSPARYRQLQENLNRVDNGSIVRTHNDSIEKFSRTSALKFNTIIVDVPCSGSGVIRRNPDIRWNREEHDLPRYRIKQLQLLTEAARLLVAGGVLVYATCSLEPEENEAVIDAFLLANPEFQLDDCREWLPESAHCHLRGPYFSPLPEEEIDGFFAARLTSRIGSD